MDNNQGATIVADHQLQVKIDRHELQVERDRHALQVEQDRNAIASERFALQQERAELIHKLQQERAELAKADLALQQDKSDLAAEQAELAGERAELISERAELSVERNRLEQAALELTPQRQMPELTVAYSGECGVGEDTSVMPLAMEQIEREREGLLARGKQLKALAREIKAQQVQLASDQLAFASRAAALNAKEKAQSDELATIKAQLASTETSLATSSKRQVVAALQLDKAKLRLKASQAKLDAVSQAVPLLEDRLLVIATLGLAGGPAQTILAMSTDQFNAQYIFRVGFMMTCKLGPKQCKRLLEMDKDKFASTQTQDKITVCLALGLKGDSADQVMALSLDEFKADSVYTRYQANKKLCDIIVACKKNSLRYGKQDSRVTVETKCPQVDRQSTWLIKHYCKLLDWLYPNGADTGANKKCSFSSNPHDSSVTFNTYALFPFYWHPLYTSGEIPKLTPDLKLFFSAPCIAGGDWVQFHGPGTMLYDIDPSFEICMGSLCDPDNNKGSFTSLSTHTNGDDIWIENSFTSPYSVSIKWEL